MAVKIINSNSSIVLSWYRALQRYYFGNKSNNPLYKEYINLNALLINKDYANNRRVNNNQSNHLDLIITLAFIRFFSFCMEF